MKHIVIGDIHGRTYWKEIDPTKYDKIVFVGDYTDGYYPMTDTEIFVNLQEIIQFKKDNFDKVVLLMGNHDLQYMFIDDHMYLTNGFRPSMATELNMLFIHNRDCFEVAYQVNHTLITHAGASNNWYKRNEVLIEDYALRFETSDLAETFNTIYRSRDNHILHELGQKRGGYFPTGGITWADRKETMDDSLLGYHQIVGHTPIDQITLFGDEQASIRYVDVLAVPDKIKRDKEYAEKKFGNGSYYDAEIKKLFPDMQLDTFKGTPEPEITKFYEFESK